MRVHLKFKIMYIHPRSVIVRLFMGNDSCAHILLDNGERVHVSVPTPKYYEEKQYRQFITEALEKELKRHPWLFHRHKKYWLETIGTYLTRIESAKKSYEFAGSEGELEVQV